MSKRLLILLCLFSYSLPLFSKTLIISDIDDTLKKSNSVGKAAEQAYHFLRKIPYFEMRDLFNEIKKEGRLQDEETKFYYVSAAYQITFNAQSWISKNKFPAGYSYLKTKDTKAPTYDFKYKTIKNLIEFEKRTLAEGEALHVLMFGDNAQFDAVVYADLSRDLHLDSKIFIRDVRAEATFFDSSLPIKKLEGVNYYFSEIELFRFSDLVKYISVDLANRAYESYKNETLIPSYTLKTLERRLRSSGVDKERAPVAAAAYWADYHHRF